MSKSLYFRAFQHFCVIKQLLLITFCLFCFHDPKFGPKSRLRASRPEGLPGPAKKTVFEAAKNIFEASKVGFHLLAGGHHGAKVGFELWKDPEGCKEHLRGFEGAKVGFLLSGSLRGFQKSLFGLLWAPWCKDRLRALEDLRGFELRGLKAAKNIFQECKEHLRGFELRKILLLL